MEKPTVLIVEDSQTVAQSLERILKKHGYTVIGIVDSGEDAVQSCCGMHPEVVLMDIWLSGKLNGIEVAEQLNIKCPTPVIFLTSDSDKEILQGAIKSQGSSYLTKPVNETELIFNIEIVYGKFRAARAVAQEKQWREAILESIIDGVIAEDPMGRIIFMNTPAKTLLEVSDNDTSRKLFEYAWFYDMEGNPVTDLSGDDRRIECQMKTLTGKSYYVIMKIKTIRDPILGFMGKALTMTNITEERVMMDRIRFLTFHDNLTGLYNRNYLEEELLRLNTGRQHPISIIMADLNGLKIFNDILGHVEGDILLKACAQQLKMACREEDIVARFGGDEFLILLPGTPEEDVKRIAWRIRSGSENIITPLGPMSIAVGHYTKMDREETLQSAISHADEDMYHNKISLKRNYYQNCFDYVYEELQRHPYEGRRFTDQVVSMLESLMRHSEETSIHLEDARLLGRVYDIGMICMPENIFGNTQINENDWEKIRRHSEMSYKIANLNPDYAHIGEAILYHHERWDGRGYPYHIKGQEIPMMARMLSVVDSYCSMTRNRPYRKALNHKEALNEIAKGAGNQFDPWVVDLFINSMANGSNEEYTEGENEEN